jgi:hypothetical protein
MKAALLVIALSGCITAAGIAKRDQVTLPLLAGAVAADLVVGTLVLAQSDSLSAAGAIASGIALTAFDLGIGCILGACTVLRP